MTVIKCKMCGGDMELSADQSFGTCEYCGSTMTLPKLDSDQRAAAFNRGNHFRRIGEFDKALTVYEQIVKEDNNDAEAHWCCALCRFGIEYVKDPASGVYLPTCHRASFDSFLEDVDYLAAVEHSDGITRRQYQEDAEKIAEVQRGILSTVQKEEPFDVFICYKESDENGNRTVDSTLAQDIYYQLTEQGRRVFFARITLEDKVGQEYEPYIFAALNSAKVMITVGTKPEYLNAVWVKNEWSRFISLMKHDRKKLLIPCYRDMDPYDLPEQLSVLQSYDMSKIGFIQDLIRGVAKVLDADKKPQQTTVVVHENTAGGPSVESLLKRGKIFLEDKDWKSAHEYFDKVLDISPECAEAYFGKVLANKQVRSEKQFVELELRQKQSNSKTERREACAFDQARVDVLATKYLVSGYLSEKEIKSRFNGFDRTYVSSVSNCQAQLKQEQQYFEQDKLLSRAMQYATGDFANQLKATQSEIYTKLQARIDQAKEQDEANIQRITAEYAAFMDNMEREVEEAYRKAMEKQAGDKAAAQKKQEQDYAAACRAQANAKSISDYQNAENLFQALGNYQDSAQRMAACQKEISRLKKEQDALAAAEAEKQRILKEQQDAERKAKNKKLAGIVGAVAAVGIVATVVMTQVIIPGGQYKDAESLLANGEYVQALVAFEALGDYKDAREQSLALWEKVAVRKTIADGGNHTVGLKSDGTVVAVGFNKSGQCDVENWNDIVAVSAGGYHTVGLKSDGTVVAVGFKKSGQCDVENWNDIVAVDTGHDQTVGLKSDGTVVAVGVNRYGQCDVEDWSDIVAVSAGGNHTVGLKSDGTVVAVGFNKFGQCDVEDWSDIIAVSAGGNHTVGLKSDGTVVAVGSNTDDQCDVEDWSDIVAVSAGSSRTVGLKPDGTVIAVGRNDEGQCDVEEWSNIVAVAIGYDYTVGLKSDGSVVAVGSNTDDQCDVAGWSNIRVPKKMRKAKPSLDRKCVILMVVLAIAIILAMLPGLLMLFYRSAPISLENLAATWRTEDTLAYYASVISTFGTLFLGSVACWQTYIIHKQVERSERVNTKRPFFTIAQAYRNVDGNKQVLPYEVNGFTLTSTERCLVYLELLNCGDGPANHFTKYPLTAFGELDADDIPQDCVAPQAAITIPVVLEARNQEPSERSICIQYENILGARYEQKLYLRETVSEKRVRLDEGDVEPQYTLVVSTLSSQIEME